MKKKIIVLAGNREQFKYWIQHNIIPITDSNDIHRLYGIEIEKVYKEGNWYTNITQEMTDIINIQQKLGEEDE